MTHRMMPILFINLGGEMMYIVNQRLIAQEVPPDRSLKVLNDIAGTMFNRKFIEEIFINHQSLYNKEILRTMFEKLVHASIMRLNENSMEKLYDLMIMAVKFQILSCRHPKEILGVTLNHLDAIRTFVSEDDVISNLQLTHQLLIKNNAELSIAQFQSIRYSILNFLGGDKIRVSVFLNEGLQKLDGSLLFEPSYLIPQEIVPAGEITFFDEDENTKKTTKFFPGMEYEFVDSKCFLEWNAIGKRGTALGTNLYYSDNLGRKDETESLHNYNPMNSRSQSHPPKCDRKFVKDELNLLAKLLCRNQDDSKNTGDTEDRSTFKLNLFNNLDTSTDGKRNEKCTFLEDFTYSRDQSESREEIEKVMKEMMPMSITEEDEDILSLLDKAT
ncbi:protein OSCP1 [Lepeophtheirus salmonis]|uniref:protein OSCP1 n=1 Tax=Lepeophtheirus salmonis TaxID=72036 RepID=UPI001AE6638C|nr:protein OSCP1-like [Lepeophtheirus salmonis]